MKLIYKERIGNQRIIHIGALKFRYSKHAIKSMLLKKDKKSQVEFYLVDAFEIYHYLPIYNELIKRGIKTRIVAEPCFTNASGSWFDYDTAIKILKELGIDYTTKANPNAEVAISTQAIRNLSKYPNKKLNLSYGVGFNKTNFGLSKESSEGFYGRLIHGQFYKDILSKIMPSEKLHIIGYPKHDDFFQNPIFQEEIKQKLNIQTNKPIIVYFPTWDENSSIQVFGDEIKKLKDNFFIATKAHHCTFRLADKKADLDKLYEISDVVLPGNSSFEYAAKLANIIIADAKSGSSSESCYINQKAPALFLSVQDDIKSYFHPEIFKMGNVINDKKALKDEIYKLADSIGKFQQTDMEYFYGNYDGCASQRAANIIEQIIKEDKRN